MTNLLDLIRTLSDSLLATTQYDRVGLSTYVANLRVDLARTASRYGGPGPQGTCEVRDLMRPALARFDRSLARILAFIQTEDDALLSACRVDATDADDLLRRVEDLVQAHLDDAPGLVVIA